MKKVIFNETTSEQKKLFNDTAHNYFMTKGTLTGKKLNDYLQFERNSWADDKELAGMTSEEIKEFAVDFVDSTL